MSYTCEKIASNKVKLTFEIPAADFDAALEKSYLKNRGRLNVPGFRKGKAPRRMIETLYGESIFYDDAFDLIFPDLYREAVEKEDLKVVDRPELSIDQIGRGQDLKVTAEVFVRPDVTLGQYKGVTVEVAPEKVEEADITARIEQDRAKASRVEEILDRPVENGDTVNLDYAGTVDGVAFEGGTAEGQTLQIGSGSFIPGFEEQMVGMCVAEERDLHVTFPEEYHAKELAGKEAVFHVKVNSISHTEMPELDDDFAADVSDYATFAEYRAAIVKELEEKAAANTRTAIENAAADKAVENAEVDIPAAMVNEELDYMVRVMEMRMRYQGFTLEQFLQMMGQTRQQFADSYRTEAQRRVKMQLVLEAIAKAEGIEATEEELEERIKAQAERMGSEDLEAFRKSLSEDQLNALREEAVVQKTVSMLADSAVVTEPAPQEEAPAEEAAEEKPEA